MDLICTLLKSCRNLPEWSDQLRWILESSHLNRLTFIFTDGIPSWAKKDKEAIILVDYCLTFVFHGKLWALSKIELQFGKHQDWILNLGSQSSFSKNEFAGLFFLIPCSIYSQKFIEDLLYVMYHCLLRISPVMNHPITTRRHFLSSKPPFACMAKCSLWLHICGFISGSQRLCTKAGVFDGLVNVNPSTSVPSWNLFSLKSIISYCYVFTKVIKWVRMTLLMLYLLGGDYKTSLRLRTASAEQKVGQWLTYFKHLLMLEN